MSFVDDAWITINKLINLYMLERSQLILLFKLIMFC